MSRNVATPAAFVASIGKTHFRVIGHGRVFKIVERKMVLGFIPSVLGHTLDGKHSAGHRIADVVFCDEKGIAQ